MRRFGSSAAGLLLAALGLCAGALAQAASMPETWDGLVQRKAKGVDAVYVRPEAVFADYRNVMLDPVEVYFDKNWKPDRAGSATRRLSTAEIEKIREGMSSEFRRIFAGELAAGGYDVVAAPLDDTLRVTAGLADVYITAPDTMSAGRTRTYTRSAGRMTLVMELRDGPTGQLLARVIDRHEDDSMQAQWTTSATNSAEFRQAVEGWAKRLVKALDGVTGRKP